MKGHTSRPAQAMERSYGGSTKHRHAINACDFTTNFRLALLSAPLGEHQLSSPALAKCSACGLRLEKLCVSGHNPLSQIKQLRARVLYQET